MNISEDFLLTIAEIAVALIGFSGVVTVLGHRDKSEWEPAELLQLRTQVEPSAVSLFGAMMPSVLGLVVSDLEVLWRTANALLLTLLGVVFVMFMLRTRKAPAVLSQHLMTIFVTLPIFTGLFCSTFNIWTQYQLTFVLGLILGILVGVHNFALLLFRVEGAT